MIDEELTNSHIELELDPLAVDEALSEFRGRLENLEHLDLESRLENLEERVYYPKKQGAHPLPPLLRCRITGDGPFIELPIPKDAQGRGYYYRKGQRYSDEPDCNQGSIRLWPETLEVIPALEIEPTQTDDRAQQEVGMVAGAIGEWLMWIGAGFVGYTILAVLAAIL